MPENAQLQFNIVVPIDGVHWLKNSSWGNIDRFVSYLHLKEGTDIEKLGNHIISMTHENFPSYDNFNVVNFLQPFLDIHFSSGFSLNM